MMTDAGTSFVGPNGNQSLVAGASAIVQLGQVIDMLGLGVGVSDAGLIIGNAFKGFYGVDPGVGRMKPEVQVNVGTALATGNAATVEFAIQYAADTGAAGNYQPGTWEDGSTTGFKPVSELAAAAVVRMDLPPAPINTPWPRYVRMIMRPASGTNLSAGTVTFAGLTMARDDTVNRYAAANYTVA